jgi:hypothetical protein
MRVRVHSLGAADTPPSRVVLRDRQDRVLSSAPVPRLRAPVDLLPKTADVTLSIPAGADWTGGRVSVETADGAREITQRNNHVRF